MKETAKYRVYLMPVFRSIDPQRSHYSTITRLAPFQVIYSTLELRAHEPAVSPPLIN